VSAFDGDAHPRVERAERVIAAPADVIFDLLADPAQHAVIDGSGSVQGARATAPQRLALGTKFSMDMKVGVPYRMTNEVIEFEEGRRLAWRHKGGHVWRYVLEPIDDSTTRVVEEFDWRPSKLPWLLKATRTAERNKAAIQKTLERLDRAVAGGGEAPPPGG
jgi:uncharacterized protein YndB with AHSA1/START domain